MTGLENELRLYKQQSHLKFNMETQPDLWEFFRQQSLKLPTWWLCAKEITLITPSSCTVERVFSMLAHGFDQTQEKSLEDYVLASIMIKYNQIWKEK